MALSDVRELRTVTVLFSDLSGFTAMSEQLDPEEVTDIVDGLFRRFRPLIESRGGTIDKFIGDAVMAVFGAPVAHEDDAARAVGAGLAMQRELAAFNAERGLSLRMRVGVHSGPILWGSIGGARATATGDTVTLAQKLEGAALPGSVLVSQATARAARRGFEFSAPLQVDLKGRPQPVVAFEAGELRQETAPRPSETPFAGRAGERERLLALWESGRGGFVAIEGEAGVGKSRLAAEVRREIRRRSPGAWAATGRAGVGRTALADALCAAHGEPPAETGALAAWAASLAGASPGPDPVARENTAHLLLLSMGIAAPGERVSAIGPERLEAEVRDAWKRWLAARAPGLLVIEDLQAADGMTLSVLESLAAAGARLVVLATARPGGRVPAGFEVLPLGDLAPPDVQRIASGILGAPLSPELEAFVADAAGGNPYYAEELSRFLAEDQLVGGNPLSLRAGPSRVPSGLEGLLVARLDSLGADHREALKAASVLGRVFWTGLLRRLLERDVAAAVEEARRRDLVRAGGASSLPADDEFAFRHALLRDAAYSLLTRKDRARLHAAAAGLLEGADAGRAVLAMAARHREAAGQPAEAAASWLRAARLALAADFPEEALNAARESARLQDGAVARVTVAHALLNLGRYREAEAELAAASALPPAPPPETWRHPWTSSIVRNRLGDYAAALDRASQAAEACEDPLDLARCLRQRVEALTALGRYDEARETLDRADRLAASRSEPAALDLQGAFLTQRAVLEQRRGNFEAALQGLYAARDMARSRGARDRGATVMLSIGATLDRTGRTREGLAVMQEALEDLRRVGNRAGFATCLGNLGALQFRLDDEESAERTWTEALALQREVGDPVKVASTLNNLAMLRISQERTGEAIALALESLELRRSLGEQPGVASSLHQLAKAHLRRGDTAAARAAAVESLAIRQGLRDRWGCGQSLLALANVDLDENRPADAVDRAREALAIFRDVRALHDVPPAIRMLAFALKAAGREDEGAVVAAEEAEALRQRDAAKQRG